MRQQHRRNRGVVQQKIALGFPEFWPEDFPQIRQRYLVFAAPHFAAIGVDWNFDRHRQPCLQRIARKPPVDRAPDLARIGILQFGRKQILRKILIAHRRREAIDGCRANRCEFRVRCGRIRAAMMHRISDFHSGRISVENQPARFAASVSINMDLCASSSGVPWIVAVKVPSSASLQLQQIALPDAQSTITVAGPKISSCSSFVSSHLPDPSQGSRLSLRPLSVALALRKKTFTPSMPENSSRFSGSLCVWRN